MSTLKLLVSVTLWITISAAGMAQTQPSPAPVSVMIVGTFHMSNPGHDIHNVKSSDVFQPEAQAEIAKVTDGLAKFRPTAVMAEWPADVASERYARYLAGTLPPSNNEVVQLGFRLAKTAGLSQFHGIDADGDFPYEPVLNFAKAHGQSDVLDRANAEVETFVQTQSKLLQDKGIAATLRYLNDPERLSHDNGFYRQMLRIGEGTQQPGVDLLTAWYRRNFLICADIVRKSRPGDRVVVFFGSGHAFLLRQCVTEMPGFTLVEAKNFLPQ